MSPRQSDIADMKCWLLRLAQKRWRRSGRPALQRGWRLRLRHGAVRPAVRLLLAPVGRRPRQPPLRVGAGEEERLADLLGLARGPLSTRPTAHHGDIFHYVLICVSSNTFTSLFLLIFTLLRPCFCIVAEKTDEEPFSRNSKGRSPSSTRAKSL